jgi:hypothetical protein
MKHVLLILSLALALVGLSSQASATTKDLGTII